MNVTSFITKEYENIANWTLGENKPNTKLNKANLQKAQMNVNKVLTKDYEKISNWAICENKANLRKGQNERNFYYNKGI